MNNIDQFYTQDVELFARSYIDYLKKVLDLIDVVEVRNFVEVILSARDRGGSIFFIGNGGSAATASHFANDLAIGTREYEKPFRAMSLSDNASVLTAIGNDDGYENIFVQQLQAYAKHGDVLVGISASGNSSNLVKAFKYCDQAGIETIALTAFDGGVLKEIAEHGVHVPTESEEYGPAEDAHMVLDHLVASYLMRAIK